MREPEQQVPEEHLPEQHVRGSSVRSPGGAPEPGEQQAGAGAILLDEDPMDLARAAQERLARSLAAMRGVPLTIWDEPAIVFRP